VIMKINSINSYNQNKNSSISKSQNKQNFGLRISPEVEHDIYQSIKGCDIDFFKKIEGILENVKSLTDDNSQFIKLTLPEQKQSHIIYMNEKISHKHATAIPKQDNPITMFANIDETEIKNLDTALTQIVKNTGE
ncbi:MAG: hypothetical protein R3Y28_06420, partial [Candidatus Gastranaerophilales bacterium]